MIDEKSVTLVFQEQLIEARIVALTPELADAKVMGEWWSEECLKPDLDPQPIDRYWNWKTYQISYNEQHLQSEKVAVVTGEGEDLAVQGAMLVSSEPVTKE